MDKHIWKKYFILKYLANKRYYNWSIHDSATKTKQTLEIKLFKLN